MNVPVAVGGRGGGRLVGTQHGIAFAVPSLGFQIYAVGEENLAVVKGANPLQAWRGGSVRIDRAAWRRVSRHRVVIHARLAWLVLLGTGDRNCKKE